MKIIRFLITGIALFLVFLVWQFPYEQMRKNFVRAVEASLPVRLAIGNVGPSFPPALQFQNLEVTAGPVRLLVSNLRLRPGIGGFLRGQGLLYLSEEKGGERFEGKWVQEKTQNRLHLRFRGFPIQTFWGGESAFPLRVSGEAELEWVGEDLQRGSGKGWALLERSLEENGPDPWPAGSPLPYDRLRAELQMKEGTLVIKRLEVSGGKNQLSLPPDFRIPLSGGSFFDWGLFFPPVK